MSAQPIAAATRPTRSSRGGGVALETPGVPNIATQPHRANGAIRPRTIFEGLGVEATVRGT